MVTYPHAFTEEDKTKMHSLGSAAVHFCLHYRKLHIVTSKYSTPPKTPCFTPGPATAIADSSDMELHLWLKIQSSMPFQHMFLWFDHRVMAKIRIRCCCTVSSLRKLQKSKYKCKKHLTCSSFILVWHSRCCSQMVQVLLIISLLSC